MKRDHSTVLHITYLYMQGFIQHSDEADPERLKQIIERAVEDGKWIVEKVISVFLDYYQPHYKCLYFT